MNWFERMCRNAGLMVHNIRDPEGTGPAKLEVQRTIEEKRATPTVTLRRTTIDEVEVKHQPPVRAEQRSGSSKPGS